MKKPEERLAIKPDDAIRTCPTSSVAETASRKLLVEPPFLYSSHFFSPNSVWIQDHDSIPENTRNLVTS